MMHITSYFAWYYRTIKMIMQAEITYNIKKSMGKLLLICPLHKLSKHLKLLLSIICNFKTVKLIIT
jgi:hypothetical protein